MRPESSSEPAPQEARDVVAFGQEVGRALSDGRIVGRAEPFAKVFPSSRPVKRAVGVTAWVILEDIALDASLDVEGRLVAETSVRRIAANLGLSKNTVSRHLARLREHGFVLHEEVREPTAGRFETARYVLDPSAALERFTVTPSARNGLEPAEEPAGEGPGSPCRNSWDTADGACPSPWDVACPNQGDAGPCPRNCDTAQHGQISPNRPVSQSSVSQELGHNREQAAVDQQQLSSRAGEREPHSQHADADPSADHTLLDRLTDLGVDEPTAHQLLATKPADDVRDALDAVTGVEAVKPAGWVVAAIRGGWDITALAAEQRRLATRRQQGELEAAERENDAEFSRRQQEHADGWSAAVVAVLDEEQLAAAIGALTDPVPGLGRRALPEVKARLAGWAAAVHLARPGLPLGEALPAALAEADGFDPSDAPTELPPPPDLTEPVPADAGHRLHAVLAALDDTALPRTGNRGG